jgi:hypothetical protein
MEITRLYLGEVTGLALVLILLFVGAAVASRYFPNRRAIATIRNIAIALVVGAFAASMTYSFVVNQIPRGQIDRTAVDQDQKAFEQRHSK